MILLWSPRRLIPAPPAVPSRSHLLLAALVLPALAVILVLIPPGGREVAAAEPVYGPWSDLRAGVDRGAPQGDWSGRLNGAAATWHGNGVMESRGHFRGSRRHGRWTFWFDNGQVRWEGSFRSGEVHGRTVEWYDSGHRRLEGGYRNGEREGPFQAWHENGASWWSGSFEGGRRQGPFRHRHPDGSVDDVRSGIYEDDRRVRALPEEDPISSPAAPAGRARPGRGRRRRSASSRRAGAGTRRVRARWRPGRALR